MLPLYAVESGLDLFCIILVLWIVKSILNTIKDFAQTAVPYFSLEIFELPDNQDKRFGNLK